MRAIVLEKSGGLDRITQSLSSRRIAGALGGILVIDLQAATWSLDCKVHALWHCRPL